MELKAYPGKEQIRGLVYRQLFIKLKLFYIFWRLFLKKITPA
jgi:hypothetical protein